MKGFILRLEALFLKRSAVSIIRFVCPYENMSVCVPLTLSTGCTTHKNHVPHKNCLQETYLRKLDYFHLLINGIFLFHLDILGIYVLS